MIANLKKLFADTFGSAPAPGTLERLEPLELVTASLLVELTRADFTSAPAEMDMAKRLLAARFNLEEAAVQELVERAMSRAGQAVSLHEFTHRLNTELSIEEKLQVIEMLWQVSFADEKLDKYEEQLVRRIAGLLHVPDRDLLRLRQKTRLG